MDVKDKLTILLALLDRPQFTYRWMKYANSIRLPFKILIADGGKDKKIEQHLVNKDNYPHLDYEYIRYPYDKSFLYYYKKVSSAMDLVQTPFTVMADNDDFIILDSLIKSVDFLIINKDYSSCGGMHYKMRIRSSMNKDYFVYGDKIKFNDLGRNKAVSILDHQAVDRVHNYFSNYRNNWYDVHHTENLKYYWDSIVSVNPQNIHLAELLVGGLGASMGKIHRATFPYLFLQEKTGENSGLVYNTQYGGLFNQMLLESWSIDINNYFNLVTEAICTVDDIEKELAKEISIKSFKTFIAKKLIKDILSETRSDYVINVKEKQNFKNKLFRKNKDKYVLKTEPFRKICTFIRNAVPQKVV